MDQRFYFLASKAGIALAFVFLLWLYALPALYSSFAGVPVVFNSPDETANYFFITRYASGMPLSYDEPLNAVGNGLIHPRSMRAVGDRVVPVSFLGMIILYGSTARIFGKGIIPWLTPLAAVAAVFFFVRLVSAVWGRRVGIMVGVLMATLAPWWYVASRGLYHNVFFVSMIVAAAYWTYRWASAGNSEKYRLGFYRAWRGLPTRPTVASLMAGLFTGSALAARMSEIGWISLAIALALVRFRKRFSWSSICLFCAALLVPLVPVLALHESLFGQFFTSGYQDMPDSVGRGAVSEAAMSVWEKGLTFVGAAFAPFGLDILQIARTVLDFGIRIFWWWALPSFAGAIWVVNGMWRRRWRAAPDELFRSQSIRVYLAWYVGIAVMILALYGSWQVSDRIDRSTYSIGTSFVRYFLPVYIGALPLIAFLLEQIMKLVSRRWLRAGALAVCFCVWIGLNGWTVLARGDESLFALHGTLTQYRERSLTYARSIPRSDIVLTYPQADKILFPDHPRMITALAYPEDYEALAQLAAQVRVRYLTFAPPETVSLVSKRDFEPHGMQITNGRRLDNWDSLYDVVLISNTLED